MTEVDFDHDAFLSHNWGDGGENHKRVERIKAVLLEMNPQLKLFLDSDRIRGGENLWMKLKTAISKSRCFVAFLTKEYEAKVNSMDVNDFCGYELNYASVSGKVIVPVSLDERMMDEGNMERGGNLWRILRGKLQIRLNNVSDYNIENCRALFDAISETPNAIGLEDTISCSEAVKRVKGRLQQSSSTNLLIFNEMFYPGTREWLLTKVLDWIASGTKRVCWIRGAAGMGKTVFAAHLACKLREEGRLLGVFFFSFNDASTSDPSEMIKCLILQILDLHPSYGNQMLKKLDSLNIGTLKPSELIDNLLLPLITDYHIGKDMITVIMIDALDEIGSAQNKRTNFLNFLSSTLINKLHAQCRVIVTGRPTSDVERSLEKWHPFIIDEDNPDHIKDLREFIIAKVKTITHDLDEIKAISELLMAKCEGKFIYLKAMSDELQKLQDDDKTTRLNKLNSFPVGLDDYYSKYLKQIFQSLSTPIIDKSKLQKILQLFAVAKQEISEDDIIISVKIPKRSFLQYKLVLRSVFPFDEKNGLFSVYHKSFVDYLTDPILNIDYYIDLHEAHRTIADILLNFEHAENKPVGKGLRLLTMNYLYRYLLDHLDEANDEGDRESTVYTKLTSLDWLQSSLQWKGMKGTIEDFYKRSDLAWREFYPSEKKDIKVLLRFFQLISRMSFKEGSEEWKRGLCTQITGRLIDKESCGYSSRVKQLIESAWQWLKEYGGYYFLQPCKLKTPHSTREIARFSCSFHVDMVFPCSRSVIGFQISFDDSSRFYLWNFYTNEIIYDLEVECCAAVVMISLNRLCTLQVQTIPESYLLSIRDASTGVIKSEYIIDSHIIQRIISLPNERVLIVMKEKMNNIGSEHHRLAVWDGDNFEIIHTLTNIKADSVTVISDEDILFITNNTNQLTRFNLNNGEIQILPDVEFILENFIYLTEQRAVLAYSNNRISFCNLESLELKWIPITKPFVEPIRQIVALNKSQILIACYDYDCLKICEVGSWKYLQTIRYHPWDRYYSRDRILVVSDNIIVFCQAKVVWDMEFIIMEDIERKDVVMESSFNRSRIEASYQFEDQNNFSRTVLRNIGDGKLSIVREQYCCIDKEFSISMSPPKIIKEQRDTYIWIADLSSSWNYLPVNCTKLVLLNCDLSTISVTPLLPKPMTREFLILSSKWIVIVNFSEKETFFEFYNECHYQYEIRFEYKSEYVLELHEVKNNLILFEIHGIYLLWNLFSKQLKSLNLPLPMFTPRSSSQPLARSRDNDLSRSRSNTFAVINKIDWTNDKVYYEEEDYCSLCNSIFFSKNLPLQNPRLESLAWGKVMLDHGGYSVLYHNYLLIFSSDEQNTLKYCLGIYNGNSTRERELSNLRIINEKVSRNRCGSLFSVEMNCLQNNNTYTFDFYHCQFLSLIQKIKKPNWSEKFCELALKETAYGRENYFSEKNAICFCENHEFYMNLIIEQYEKLESARIALAMKAVNYKTNNSKVLNYISYYSDSSSFPVTTGKWYYEVTISQDKATLDVGWAPKSQYKGEISQWTCKGGSHGLGVLRFVSWRRGDVIGCALDLDENRIYFYLNGLGEEIGMGLIYDKIDRSEGGVYPFISLESGVASIQFNFGSSPFKYDPPPSFQPYIYGATKSALSQLEKIGVSTDCFNDALMRCGKDISKAFTLCHGNFPQQRRFPDVQRRLPADVQVTIAAFLNQHTIANPLEVISGEHISASKDLCYFMRCSSNDEIVQLGCRSFPVLSGKWYYEIENLIECFSMNIGWATSLNLKEAAYHWWLSGGPIEWKELEKRWRPTWSNGSVIGCALDLDENRIYFYLNGLGEEIGMGLIYDKIDRSEGGVYPFISLESGVASIQFNFGSSPFKYDPPPPFQPYIYGATKSALSQLEKTGIWAK